MNNILAPFLSFAIQQLLTKLPLGTHLPPQAADELSEAILDLADGELSNQKQLEVMGAVDDTLRKYGLSRSV